MHCRADNLRSRSRLPQRLVYANGGRHMVLASWPPGATASPGRGPVGGASAYHAHHLPAPANYSLRCWPLGRSIRMGMQGALHYSELTNIIKRGNTSLVVVILAGIARLYG